MDTKMTRPAFARKNLRRGPLLYQILQEEIKSYIIENGLKPGDPLPPETELTGLLGVSRNSVREAVKSLETLGLIEARPGAGLFVTDFSFDPMLDHLAYGIIFGLKELAEILEVRFHIEYGMTERAVQSVSPAQLERLHGILEHMRTAAEQGQYSATEDRAFHHALWEDVGNATVSKILDIFWMVFQQAQKRDKLPPPVDPMNTYQRHVDIVEALEQKDLAKLRTAVKRHYVGIEERLRQLQKIVD